MALGEKGERLGGSCSFQVQEYKANAFEILIPPPPNTFGSTQLTLPITAKYFMGKPLSKAKLTWSLVARDEPLTPEGLERFAFANTIGNFRLNRALDRISQFNAQGETPISEAAPQRSRRSCRSTRKHRSRARRNCCAKSPTSISRRSPIPARLCSTARSSTSV
jgi:hypothetical protein